MRKICTRNTHTHTHTHTRAHTRTQSHTCTAAGQAGITSGALASAAVGATNVLGTLIATGLIERAGRKQLLLQSYGGMAAAMLIMAAGFTLPALSQYAGAAWATLPLGAGLPAMGLWIAATMAGRAFLLQPWRACSLQPWRQGGFTHIHAPHTHAQTHHP